MHSPPFFSSTSSESRWVNHISNNYTKNLSFDPCVFQVPQSLRDQNPQAYTPQVVGLGPFHHLRPDVQETENLKRTLVKDFLYVADLEKFIKFVVHDQLEPKKGQKSFQSTILPHYDRCVDLESSTLLWILAIDGIFLMQFLKDESRWKDHRMVADIMMLENQIPLLLLEKLGKALEEEDSFPGVAEVQLFSQFRCFCREQSPLKLRGGDPVWQEDAFGDANHLLDFLYLWIVENDKPRQESGKKAQTPRSYLEVLKQAIPIVGNFTAETAELAETAIKQATAQGVRLPQPINKVSNILEQLQKVSDLPDKRDKDVQPQHRLANKIHVPSVSQLSQLAGIDFVCCPDDGGIRNIFFDDDNNTLYLPEITLSETSEVVLRNLVAHEAASKPVGSVLEFAEYVDLMCGIIHSENDVKLLKQSGIIKGNLLDEEIVRIFNGINKSIQIPDELSEIQRTVQKLSDLFRQQEETSENEPVEVPSVSKLREAEIKIAYTNCNILYSKRTATLQLLQINLGDTSHDALEKLDAEEAEYVDFMCSIIKGAADVKPLKEFDVIKGNLPDEEISRIFNEINISSQIPPDEQLKFPPDEQSKIQRIKQKLSIVRSKQKLSNLLMIPSDEQSQIQRTKQKLSNLFQPSNHGLPNEIEVGSASNMEAIVNFVRTDGGKRNILLEQKKRTTLKLPEIELGDSSLVALEKLNAYDAEDVGFMRAIIQDVKDVTLLKKFKIIKGDLPDEEIFCIFNGINKIRNEQSEIQRTIQELSDLFRQPGEASENILANEIEAPSVSKLDDAGIKFACTDGGSKGKILLEKGTTLYLPEIKLGDTRKAALKKLGAYEAEYVDFMCSIIKGPKDVDLLKKSEIIKGNLPDDQIALLFKGHIEWPNVEPTQVQETVHKLNIKFRNLSTVKAYKSFKNFFERFQRWVKRLFPTFVLLLLILQSAFEIHGWVRESRRSGYGAASMASSSFGLEDSEPKLILPRKVLGYDPNLM